MSATYPTVEADPTISAGQKAALAGSSGTPGSGNKFLTEGDSALARYASAGTWAADQRFNGKVGVGIDPATMNEKLHVKETGQQRWAVKLESDWNVLVVGHIGSLSAGDSNPHDVVDIFDTGTGDSVFVHKSGGVVPNFTFTATADGSSTLAAVSSFTGLANGTKITGTGVPANTTIVSTSVGAATLLASNPIAAGVGIVFSVATPPGTPGGDAAFNALIPYHLDGVGTGRDGTIVNNRQGANGFFIEIQASGGGRALLLKHQGAAPAIDLTNQDPAFAHGNGKAVQIADYSTDTGIELSKFVLPSVANSAVLKLGIPGTAPSTPAGGTGASADVIRGNDQNGVGRFLVRSDGQTVIGWNYPSSQVPTVKLASDHSATGIARVLALSNSRAGNNAGDGVQVEYLISGNQWALTQCVLETGGGSTLRFSARKADFTQTERLRLGLTGVGFNGQAPVQPTLAADATDLATAIALANDIKAKLRAIAGGLGLMA